MVDRTREIALKALYRINEDNAYSNIVLDDMIKQNRKNLNQKDIGLISEIAYGVVTWKLTLDEIINKYSRIKLKKVSPWILNVLRMGVYQIIFLDKIPKSAAVNECVNLAKRYGHKSSANFVNAILRKVEKKDYEELFNIEDDIERISKTTSMPVWIIEELLNNQDLEIQEVERICKNSNLKPEVAIRINNLKIKKEELKQNLQIENIPVKEGILKDFLVLTNVKNIENIDSFKKGYFTIEDEAAGLVAMILKPKEGEYILDACSAPGGKTTYISELMNNKGKIEAWDIYEHRLNLVNSNAKRLGNINIETKLNDATLFKEEYVEKFDKILLDVPCLGMGVLKRKPDIKWQRNKEDIEKITKIQMEILENCSKYLKTNGELVYSTCSIFYSENEKLIKKFLENNENFELKCIELKNGIYNKEFINYFEKYIKNNNFLQVYQNEKTDGFFMCKIIKK